MRTGVLLAALSVAAGPALGDEVVLRNGDRIGVRSLHTRCPGGASGHEMDKLSPSSPPGVRVLAKGLNPEGSGAEMALYEAPGGGAVFAAGSISFAASLPVDEGIAAVTRNVLRRFAA